MNYRDLYDKVEQAGSFHISNLALILLDLEVRSDALEEILTEIPQDEFDRLFPVVKSLKWYNGIEDMEKHEIIELLTDIDKLGFISEIGVHQKSGFRFNEDGSFRSCSVHQGTSYVTYAYGDTIEELIESIQESCEKFEKIDIEKHKKEEASKANKDA